MTEREAGRREGRRVMRTYSVHATMNAHATLHRWADEHGVSAKDVLEALVQRELTEPSLTESRLTLIRLNAVREARRLRRLGRVPAC